MQPSAAKRLVLILALEDTSEAGLTQMQCTKLPALGLHAVRKLPAGDMASMPSHH